MSYATEILDAVVQLKQESETWRAVAEQYRVAFEEQTVRLRELQDICVATQAELENERMGNRRCQAQSSPLRDAVDLLNDGTVGGLDDHTFGVATAVSKSRVDLSWDSSSKPSSPYLQRIEQLASQRDYGTALKEIDHLLQSPLPPDTRIEGLLLKSNLMRKSEWLYDALATCSEALELCDCLEELHCYLPRVQYQRGLCYFQLNMVQQAQAALDDASTNDDSICAKPSALRLSCEEHLQPGRRPGFEAYRSATEDLLAPANEHCFDSKRSRTSSQVRVHISKAKRFSLPQRWTTARSKSAGFS